MANEFIIKKGLISKADSVVSGSLIITEGVSGSFSGSFEGDGSGLTNVPTTTTSSYALTASYVETAQTASYVISSSIEGITNYVRNDQTSSMTVATASYVETAQTASYVLNAVSSSYSSFAVSASYAVSASHEIIKEVSSSYADTASFAQSGDGIFSGSFSGSFEGDGSGLTNVTASFSPTASYALTASYVETAQTASYVHSSSIDSITDYVRNDQTSSMTVLSSSFATTSSYVEYSNVANKPTLVSGSSQISYTGITDVPVGILSSSAQIATEISGAFTADSASFSTRITTNETDITSLTAATSSYVLNSQTSSMTVATASYVETAQTASYVLNAISSSYAETASFAQSGNGIFSGSFSGSFEGDGSQLTNLPMGTSASYAATASYVETAQTASYVTTSSIDGITNYVRNDQTSSMTVLSSSFAISSSHSETTDFILGGNVFGPVVDAVNAVSSSYSATASYVETAQTASYVLNAVSSSYSTFALSALSASYAPGSPTISSSYALTASYVNPLTQDVDITGQTDITGNVLVTGSLTVSGSNSIVNLQELQFDTEHIATGHTTGRMYWSDSNKTVNLDMQGSDVVLQLGQEEHVYVQNTSGVTINNGDAVRINGAAGSNVTVTKAISSIKSFKDTVEQDQILGVATEQIANSQFGYITTFGAVRDLDTSTFNEGDILYLSNITSGSYTNIRPPAPFFEARVGTVQVANPTEGIILARPQEPIFLTDVSQVTGSGVIVGGTSYLCYDDNTEIIGFTNSFTGSFSGSFQGKLGPISNTTYRLTSSLYTASAVDYRIGVKYTLTGSVSIQLPLISDVGEIEYKFKDEEGNAQTNNITLTPSGSNLIDGDINAILNRNNMAIGLYNDGVSNWFVE